MDVIPAIKVLNNEFQQKYKTSFDYLFYNELVLNRKPTNTGLVKASSLINEMAMLILFCANHQTKEVMNGTELSVIAFAGWNFSNKYILQDIPDAQIYKELKKESKITHKQFNKMGIDISLSELAWLLYSCALLRAKLYSEFDYEMLSLMIENLDDEGIIRVAFKRKEFNMLE